MNFHCGASDWKVVPSPLLKDVAKARAIGTAVMPKLESHIVVASIPAPHVHRNDVKTLRPQTAKTCDF